MRPPTSYLTKMWKIRVYRDHEYIWTCVLILICCFEIIKQNEKHVYYLSIVGFLARPQTWSHKNCRQKRTPIRQNKNPPLWDAYHSNNYTYLIVNLKVWPRGVVWNIQTSSRSFESIHKYSMSIWGRRFSLLRVEKRYVDYQFFISVSIVIREKKNIERWQRFLFILSHRISVSKRKSLKEKKCWIERTCERENERAVYCGHENVKWVRRRSHNSYWFKSLAKEIGLIMINKV